MDSEQTSNETKFLSKLAESQWKESTLSQEISLDLKELTEDELAFLQMQTGINDMQRLTEHAEDVARKAYKARRTLLVFKLPFLPAYQHVLELGKSRKGAILLDIGCCFGQDVRKAAMDGYPVENIVTSDLHPEFWFLGHELFKTTPETFPVRFIPGDVFDDGFIPDRGPFLDTLGNDKPSSNQDLQSLKSLQGRISFIHATALFHLFNEQTQQKLARKLGSLLSPEKGSVIFGMQPGFPMGEAGERVNPRGERIFCHDPESWKRLWVGEQGVFPEGVVEVQMELQHIGVLTEAEVLMWSVKRI
ncbi:hypothetical protein VKT23_011260 [Stygiomarasmius scandens]|uniref:Methyltransferase ausD n=1 Tax=Marasmiellus scandens TaxID=2682957 RepID=A0ABR1J9W3_9AGAR